MSLMMLLAVLVPNFIPCYYVRLHTFFFFCLTPLLLPVVFRLSGTIRASSPWDVRGREVMWWVAWWTWLNAP